MSQNQKKNPPKRKRSLSSTQTQKRKRADSTLEKSSILLNISQLISQRQTRAAKLKNDQLVGNAKEDKKILE